MADGRDESAPTRAPVLGGVALAFYVAHAVDVCLGYPAANLLWSCNVGAAFVAVGLLAGAPVITAAGALLLIAGEPFWIADLAGGGPFLPTAPLTHVGVLVLALVGLRRTGLPRWSWLVAAVALAIATAAARVVGPSEENINLAFRIPEGFEGPWPSHGVYLAVLGTVMAAVFGLLQAGLRRLGFAGPKGGAA